MQLQYSITVKNRYIVQVCFEENFFHSKINQFTKVLEIIK